MATSGNRDVQLLIRAKDEASKTFELASAALAKLLGATDDLGSAAPKTGSRLEELASAALAVDRAVTKIYGSADTASVAFDRMSSRLAENKAQLAALQAQAEQARQVIGRLNSPDAIVDAGRTDQGDRLAKIRAAEQELQRLTVAEGRLKTGIVDQEAALAQQRVSMQRIGSLSIAAADAKGRLADAVERENQALQKNSAQWAGYDRIGAAIAVAARETAAMDAEVARLRNSMNPLASIEANLTTQTQRLKDMLAAGRIEAHEFAPALAMLQANAEKAKLALNESNGLDSRGRPTLFGMKPYQLTNLGYQVNDVVSGFAMGQRPMQILAQQGGQILQLFPKVGAAVAAGLTSAPVIAFTASVGVLVLAMHRAQQESETLRTFQGMLAASGDAANYQAEALTKADDQLRRYGLSADEAVAAIRTFINDGVNPDRLVEFGHAAQNMAEILGIKLPEAAKQTADAFTGGYNAIKSLDEATNFLTATERDQIKTLFDQGRASEARTQALEIFTRKMDDAAHKARGTWSQAGHDLGRIWDGFISGLAATPQVQSMTDGLNDLADALDRIAGKAPDAGQAPGRLTAAAVQSRIAQLQQNLGRMQAMQTAKPGDAQIKGWVDDLNRRINNLKTTGSEAGDPLNPQSGKMSKETADKLSALQLDQQIADLEEHINKIVSKRSAARLIELAGERAFRQEIEASGNATIANEQKRLAITQETKRVQAAQETARRQAQADENKAIADFESHVIGAEGGKAKNPHSGASGYGQFTPGTWTQMFDKIFPDQAGLDSAAKLALRGNEAVAKAIIDAYTKQNVALLKKIGAQITSANLYMLHFLGPGTGAAMLQAAPGTPVENVIRRTDPKHASAVLSGNQNYLFDKSKGRYRTAGELQTFLGGRMGETGAAQSAGEVAITNLMDDAEKKQTDFNLAIREENDQREQTVKSLRTEQGLRDTALIATQRQAAIDEAVLALKKKADDANKSLKEGQAPIVVTQQQIDDTKRLTAAVFDLAHARDVANAKLHEAQQPVDDLNGQRDALMAQRQALQENGMSGAADALIPQIQTVNSEINTATENLINFYETLKGNPDDMAGLNLTAQGVDNIITKLRTAQLDTQDLGYYFGISGKQIAQDFTSKAVSGIDRFSQEVGTGTNVFRAFADGIRQTAAEFLRQIAQMIEQQIIFNAVSAFLRSFGGGIGGGGGGAGAALHDVPGLHSGGIVGREATFHRAVSPAWFATAMRYHSGGVAGLRADEVPAILQRGEEVITAADPRHRDNGGTSGHPGVNIKQINVIDSADMLEQALATSRGEKVLLNWISNNPAAMRMAQSM